MFLDNFMHEYLILFRTQIIWIGTITKCRITIYYFKFRDILKI